MWADKAQGEAYPVAIYQQGLGQAALTRAQQSFFETLLEDTLVNAGLEINRRIIGFAGVADFKEIADADLRAECERSALKLARELIVNARQYEDLQSVARYVQHCNKS